MADQKQAQWIPPKEQPGENQTQERGLFHHEARKHESHHYVRMYGGQVVNAAMWGFGATLGADAANSMVGDVKVCDNAKLHCASLLTRVCTGVVATLMQCMINAVCGQCRAVNHRLCLHGPPRVEVSRSGCMVICECNSVLPAVFLFPTKCRSIFYRVHAMSSI